MSAVFNFPVDPATFGAEFSMLKWYEVMAAVGRLGINETLARLGDKPPMKHNAVTPVQTTKEVSIKGSQEGPTRLGLWSDLISPHCGCGNCVKITGTVRGGPWKGAFVVRDTDRVGEAPFTNNTLVHPYEGTRTIGEFCVPVQRAILAVPAGQVSVQGFVRKILPGSDDNLSQEMKATRLELLRSQVGKNAISVSTNVRKYNESVARKDAAALAIRTADEDKRAAHSKAVAADKTEAEAKLRRDAAEREKTQSAVIRKHQAEELDVLRGNVLALADRIATGIVTPQEKERLGRIKQKELARIKELEAILAPEKGKRTWTRK